MRVVSYLLYLTFLFLSCFFLGMNTPSDSELINYALHLEQQQQEENEPNVIDNNLHGGERSNLSFNFIF